MAVIIFCKDLKCSFNLFFLFPQENNCHVPIPISHCCNGNFLYKDAKIHKAINTATLQKWLENKKPVSLDCQGWNNYFPSGQNADSWHSHIFHMEWGDTHPWDRQWVGGLSTCLQGKTAQVASTWIFQSSGVFSNTGVISWNYLFKLYSCI